MKCSRSSVHCKTWKIPAIQFEKQTLTSFSGLVLFQKLFARLSLREKLYACFRHLGNHSIFGPHLIALLLVVHLLLGYRRLRDCRYYQQDPLVQRLLGLRRLPDVATISRVLANTDARAVARLRRLVRRLCLDRLRALGLPRLTVDFDGSVQSTHRWAEGTAVGFNRKEKGARSYYPLFCTIAQVGQVFDLLHRSGNVHDSRDACPFILRCMRTLRSVLPGVKLEARFDAAFFSDQIVTALNQEGVEFTISVPFERFVDLKGLIEGRQRWKRFNHELSYFEADWKPACWDTRYPFVFVRQRAKRQFKGPVQLDLFVPSITGYDFKVIVTNKQTSVKKLVAFHNGRGAQEAIFGELKSQAQMDYIPVRTLAGNQIYLWSAVLAHNLSRELQMLASTPQRHTTEKRSPFWIFQELNTLRRNLIQRAGRLTRPQGKLTLTISGGPLAKDELLHYLRCLRRAA
jgi:hypothetical protein